MKKILLILILFSPVLLSAQPYESIFGKDSTQWNYVVSGMDFLATNIYKAYTNDSLIDSKQYRCIYLHEYINDDTYLWGFLREDTLQGKVWVREVDDSDEKLMQDMDVIEDDTVYFYHNSTNYNYCLVSSIDTVSGRVIIDFYGSDWPCDYYFVQEGMIGYLWAFYSNNQELLCVFKDGELQYHNAYWVECIIKDPYDALSDLEKSKYSICNNEGSITIVAQDENNPVETIRMYSLEGALLVREVCNSTEVQINAGVLPAGVYVIVVNNKYSEKVVIE